MEGRHAINVEDILERRPTMIYFFRDAKSPQINAGLIILRYSVFLTCKFNVNHWYTAVVGLRAVANILVATSSSTSSHL